MHRMQEEVRRGRRSGKSNSTGFQFRQSLPLPQVRGLKQLLPFLVFTLDVFSVGSGSKRVVQDQGKKKNTQTVRHRAEERDNRNSRGTEKWGSRGWKQNEFPEKK